MSADQDDRFFLKHILQSIEKIELLMRDVDRESFLEDWRIQDAVVRNLEIIGEASSKISDEFNLITKIFPGGMPEV